jgi:hypothetical protein
MPLIVKICLILWIITFGYMFFLRAWASSHKLELIRARVQNRLAEMVPIAIGGCMLIINIVLTCVTLIYLIARL